jgi:hypothetical protein
MSGYFLVIIALITLSMKNKRYISLILVFTIISSLVFSTTLYHISITKSKDGDNSIARYLANNTNNGTIYLTDLASSVESTAKCRVKSNATIQNNSILEDGRDTSYNDSRTEVYVYGFWNQGNINYVNSRNISQKVTEGYKKIYLISPNSLPYDKVANNGNFTLYQVT